MPKQVKYVAQTAMDDYLQNFADGTTFWTLNDFVTRVGNIAADFYQKEWKKTYDELRAEGKWNEVVAFDAGFLAEQIVELKRVEMGNWEGVFTKLAMSFPYDMQASGYQLVFDAKTGKELERSNPHETWQYQYQPLNDRLFFRIERDKLKVSTKGNCTIQAARVMYVPSILIGDGDEWLPDGIVGYCIAATVAYMRELAGKPIKKSLDGNQNMAFETEANLPVK